MGATTLHAGIVAKWFCNFFEDILLFMVVNGILFGVKTPHTNTHIREQ